MDAALFQEPRRRKIPIESPWGGGDMAVLDFGDPDRPVDVVFLHANGFNALTYRSILAPLAASLRIVAADMRGHGATTLPAQTRGRKSWRDFRDDVIALLEALGGPPVTLAGHSMGGGASVLAAAARPDRVSNLALFDPVIWTPLQATFLHLPLTHALGTARAPLVQGALRRRRRFDSHRAALEAYRGRGAFKGWSDTVLADYVAGGFREAPEGGVELACTPEWEASNFASQANDTARDLVRFGGPVRILRAAHHSTCALTEASPIVRRAPKVKIETVDGTHFFPMQRPDLVRDAIFDAAV